MSGKKALLPFVCRERVIGTVMGAIGTWGAGLPPSNDRQGGQSQSNSNASSVNSSQKDGTDGNDGNGRTKKSVKLNKNVLKDVSKFFCNISQCSYAEVVEAHMSPAGGNGKDSNGNSSNHKDSTHSSSRNSSGSANKDGSGNGKDNSAPYVTETNLDVNTPRTTVTAIVALVDCLWKQIAADLASTQGEGLTDSFLSFLFLSFHLALSHFTFFVLLWLSFFCPLSLLAE